MGYHEIEVTSHVSEALPDIIPKIQTGEDIMLKAATGGGKTTAMLKLAKEMPGKRIALLCPTRTLVDNIGKDNPGIACGYRHDFLVAHTRSVFIVTTYDSLKAMKDWKRPPELLIIDEAHLIVGHSQFREITATILETSIQKVFLSATPEIIEAWSPIRHHLEIIGPKIPKSVNIARLRGRKPTSVIRDLIQGRDIDRYAEDDPELFLRQGRLLMIRYNNKKELQSIYDRMPQALKDVTAVYYSGVRELDGIWPEAHFDMLARGEIPKSIEILLITSIYDAGLSLTVYRDVDCYAVSYDNRRMPHPIDMIQLQNRVRFGGRFGMNLTLIGNYGKLPLDDIKGLPDKSNPMVWLRHAGTAWDMYEELDEDSYVGILDYYGVRAHGAALPAKSNHKQGHRLSDYEIARNLQSIDPKSYSEVVEGLRHNNCMDWAEYINGTADIRSNGIPTRAITIKNQLIEAVKRNLHFGLFMGEGRYNDKRANHLINAVDLYRKRGRFTEAIDQLVEGGIVNKVLPLDKYDMLVKDQQKMFREVGRLFFDLPIKDGRKQVKLKAKPLDGLQRELVYKECLINGKDDIW